MLAFGVNWQADEDIGRGTTQVLAELGAHAFGKDFKRWPAVKLKNEIVVGLRDPIHGTHRLAGLGDTNSIGELTTQQCTTYCIITDRVSTQLERLTNAPVLRRPTSNKRNIRESPLGYPVKESL